MKLETVSSQEELFFDFDTDFENDFVDNDKESIIEDQKSLMNHFNQSHKMLSAKEFLDNNQAVVKHAKDLEKITVCIVIQVKKLDGTTLLKEVSEVIAIFEMCESFFKNLEDFTEVATALGLLAKVLLNTNFSAMQTKHKEFVAQYLSAILEDIADWKQHVIVKQDAIDVFYINAALLSSCIQLESMLKG